MTVSTTAFEGPPSVDSNDGSIEEIFLEQRRSAGDPALGIPTSLDNLKLEDLLTQLFHEYGASDLAQWIVVDGQLTGVLDDEIDGQVAHRAKELAEKCLGEARVCFRMFSSRSRYFLVAAPVPYVEGYAVTARFPFSRKHDNDRAPGHHEKILLRCRDLSVVASHLALIRMQSKCAEMGAQLHQLQKNSLDNTPFESLGGSLRQSCKLLKLAAKGTCKNPLKLLVVVACIAFFGLIPVPHTISCGVTCEPATRRYVAAPFDAKLLKTYVMPGDQVESGQVIAILDGSDLRSELAGRQAELSQATQRRAAAMSASDAASSELERLEVTRLQAEIAMLQQQADRLEIKAPMKGMVVSGNLERKQGAPLSMGENLFEIAPLDDLVVEIAIPESEISYVGAGQNVRISLAASHGSSQTTKVERIHPRSELRGSNSVFVAEATIDNASDQLRPGMQGKAKVSAGLKPLAWVLFHHPYEVVRAWVGW